MYTWLIFIYVCAWSLSSDILAEAFCIDPLPSYSGQRQLLWCGGVLQDLSGIQQPNHMFCGCFGPWTCRRAKLAWWTGRTPVFQTCRTQLLSESLSAAPAELARWARATFSLPFFNPIHDFFLFKGSCNLKRNIDSEFCFTKLLPFLSDFWARRRIFSFKNIQVICVWAWYEPYDDEMQTHAASMFFFSVWRTSTIQFLEIGRRPGKLSATWWITI